MIALFVGRFQPFHNGHLKALEIIAKENKKVLVAIGSSQFKNKPENPFSAKERQEMIIKSAKQSGIRNFETFFVPDIFDDNAWVQHLLKITGKADIVYTGSLLTKKLFENQGFKVKELERIDDISASLVRLKIAKGLEWKSLVPDAVAELIEKTDGIKRIRRLMPYTKSDF